MARPAACALAALLALPALPAEAQTMRWAADRDLATLDPHAADAFTLGVLGNIHEGLVRRRADLALEPALATDWRAVAPEVWRFTLREGVVFYDGRPFGAEDVARSLTRAQQGNGRDLLAGIAELRVVDPRTIELVTTGPDPVLPQRLDRLAIVPRGSGEAHADAAPPPGTGPFRVVARMPGRVTRLVRHPGWWDRDRGMIVEAELWPIPADATRVAALEAGDVDLITAVPPGAMGRLGERPGLRVLATPAPRTVLLGLGLDPVAGTDGLPNPLADGRVRHAIAHAIDVEGLIREVMSGAALPAGLLWGPGVAGYRAEEDRRPAFDLDRARALVAEAAMPADVGLRLACADGELANAGALCAALVPMLSRIGIRLDVFSPAREASPPRAGAHLVLLGWTAETFDAEHTLAALAAAPDPLRGLGRANLTGYDRPELTILIEALGGTVDPTRRQALIDQAAAMLRADAVYLPLLHEVVLWAHRDRVRVAGRGDGVVMLNAITLR